MLFLTVLQMFYFYVEFIWYVNFSITAEIINQNESLYKKCSFPLRISSVKVTKCTVETLHEKLYFLCSDRTTKQFINIIYHYCIITIIFIITIILLYSFLVMTNVTHIFQHFSPFSHFRACSLPGHKTSFSSLDKAC